MRGDENKHDAGKPMWDLLPWEQVEDVVHILTFGADKYGPLSWQQVEQAEDRYFAALMRHIVAWRKGEVVDAESGRPHLAHAVCNALFLMWFNESRG